MSNVFLSPLKIDRSAFKGDMQFVSITLYPTLKLLENTQCWIQLFARSTVTCVALHYRHPSLHLHLEWHSTYRQGLWENIPRGETSVALFEMDYGLLVTNLFDFLKITQK